jgi:hypothetical protein
MLTPDQERWIAHLGLSGRAYYRMKTEFFNEVLAWAVGVRVEAGARADAAGPAETDA